MKFENEAVSKVPFLEGVGVGFKSKRLIINQLLPLPRGEKFKNHPFETASSSSSLTLN
jgi:hypothetical protein